MPKPIPCVIAVLLFDGEVEDWSTLWRADAEERLTDEALVADIIPGWIKSLQDTADGDEGNQNWTVEVAWSTDHSVRMARENHDTPEYDHEAVVPRHTEDEPLIAIEGMLNRALQDRLREAFPNEPA